MIRELLSQTDLAMAPVIALLLFFTMFVAVVARTWMRQAPAGEQEHITRLPLDDGAAGIDTRTGDADIAEEALHG